MTGTEAFFESFNMSLQAAYDAYFKIAQKDVLKGLNDGEEELRSYISNETARWGATPLTELGKMTPAEYLDTLGDLDRLLEMFRAGAGICDDDLPEIFLERLRSFGDAAVEALLGMCRDFPPPREDEKSLMASLTAVQVLGGWKASRAVGVMIGMIDNYNEDSFDLVCEKVVKALQEIGEPSIGEIIKAIESRDADSPQIEYLLTALADIACKSRSDAAYRCLKDTFLKMASKSVGAFCLGNYGDGRAIPALRGYLLKNRDKVDKETFFDIVSAVERLGGSVDDLGSWTD